MAPLAERFSLKGKRAFVTGSSRGIGKAVAYALAEAGAHVILHGTKDSPALSETLDAARANGWSVESVTGDLGNTDDLEKIIAATLPADILILNASAQKYGTLEAFTPEEFDVHFDVNVKHSLRLIQAFLPAMQAKHFGRVIALGSVNQWKQSPRLVIYSATKSALSNVMQNCARKYACDNITFNTIAPGVMATDRNREALSDPATVEKLMTVIPSKRFGTPEDCAGLALLLASDAGSYITGTDIPVAGGMQL